MTWANIVVKDLGKETVMRVNQPVTNVERQLRDGDSVVSKTDL